TMTPLPSQETLFPYTTLFRSENKSVQGQRVGDIAPAGAERAGNCRRNAAAHAARCRVLDQHHKRKGERHARERVRAKTAEKQARSEEHTSELQSRGHLVCRLL